MNTLKGKKATAKEICWCQDKKKRLIVSGINGPHMEVLLAKHCNNKYSKPTVGRTRITSYKPESSVNERDYNVKLWVVFHRTLIYECIHPVG